MKLKSFYIFFLLFSLSDLIAQGEGKVVYNQHKNELSVDIKDIIISPFTASDIDSEFSSSLIFKKRIGEKKFISLNEKKVIRFLVGASIKQPFINEDSLFALNNQPASTYSLALGKELFVSLKSGLEWQKQHGRFQHYFGMDLGVEFSDVTFVGIVTIPNNRIETTRRRFINIPANCFFGFKYFLAPKISFSLETSLDMSYQIVLAESRKDNPTNIEPEKFSVNRFLLDFNYIRFINISYYL